MPLWSESHLVVIDVEGNGAPSPEIVEVAVVHIVGGNICDRREWMVRPTVPVTAHGTRVHGITNEDLRDMPAFAEVAAELRVELGSRAVIGHHVGVDASLLKRQLRDWSPATCIDTLRLARHIYPDAAGYSLQALHERCGCDQKYDAHRALDDALMTAHVFLSMISELEKHMFLDLLALARIGASLNDPLLQDQQHRLFK